MKSRQRVSEEILESLRRTLAESLERGCLSWPLPQPPHQHADLPAKHPQDARDVTELGLSLVNADRGMFDRHLKLVVDLIVPHRMNLMDDPFEVHEKWLLKRVDDLSERMLFAISTEWLAQALDPSYPDTDRWWLAIALINGLCIVPYGQSVHQGYHLVESIALGQRPGTWHTQPEDGPHNWAWNPHTVTSPIGSIEAHETGMKAAVWLMQRLEDGDENRRLLLIEWIRLLLERPELFSDLELSQFLKRRCNDSSEDVASRVVGCLAKLIENEQQAGLECVKLLHKRKELLVRRNMADVLTRLFRRIEWDAVPLLEDMLNDEDESIRAVAASTAGDLRFLDAEMWADKLQSLSQHDCAAVRRNIVNSIRFYVEMYPEDERKIIEKLWAGHDEVVMTRLREMLLRFEETNTELFSHHIKTLEPLGLKSLWPPLDARRPERSKLWLDWLDGKAELPEAPMQVQTHVSDFSESELPSLQDAQAQLKAWIGENEEE